MALDLHGELFPQAGHHVVQRHFQAERDVLREARVLPRPIRSAHEHQHTPMRAVPPLGKEAGFGVRLAGRMLGAELRRVRPAVQPEDEQRRGPRLAT